MTDLISRQKAIKWVKTECNPYGKPTLDFESGMKVIEHLKHMPAIGSVKYGKWKPYYKVLEETADYFVSASGYECSECGTIFHNQWNFCGNCGAVMEKADEN